MARTTKDPDTVPVSNWKCDFDHMDPAWTSDPHAIWRMLRNECRVSHSDRYGGVYLPTHYEDIIAAAYNNDVYSSRTIIIRSVPLLRPFSAPPMNSLGKGHPPARKRLMKAFTPEKVDNYRQFVSIEAETLAASAKGRNYDLAKNYSHKLTIKTIMHILGIPQYNEDLLTKWTKDLLIFGINDAKLVDEAARSMAGYCYDLALDRFRSPKDDITSLLIENWNGVDKDFIYEVALSLRLVILAGIDTTASVLSGALHHLAESKNDCNFLLQNPDHMQTAVEEFLRFYAPTTMARYIERDAMLGGVLVKAGQLLMLPFPAANRDPTKFFDPDQIRLNRHPNKHLAFGAGIHRCIGDHLARMIVTVGLRVWLRHQSNYKLEENECILWSPGTVRGITRLFVHIQPTVQSNDVSELKDHERGMRSSMSVVDKGLGARDSQLFKNAKNNQAAKKFTKALQYYRSILSRNPSHIDSLLGIGATELAVGNDEEAVKHFKRAAALAPYDFRSFHNLASLALNKSNLAEALMYAECAVQASPDDPDAHRSIADISFALGQSARGLKHVIRASDLRPGDSEFLLQKTMLKRQICDWTNFDEDDHSVRSLVASGHRVPPLAFMSTEATNAEQHVCAKLWAQSITKPKSARLPVRKLISRPRIISIGYLSGDFYDHATSRLVAELFECHDRSRVKITGYSYGPDTTSAMQNRINSSFDTFRMVSKLSSELIARTIHDDAIDILVDMKGYTSRARSDILAFRPAPIQVNYLGFPGTMGADFIDYVITDRHVSPESYQAHATERFAYLPQCFQPNDTKRSIPNRNAARSKFGIPEAGFIFCCYNAAYKITPKIFSAWMRILHAVPESKLCLLSRSVEQNLLLNREAESRGIDSDRLIPLTVVEPDQHLVRCAISDLFLDTIPVSGFTTASDALWAGLPIVTVAGDTPAGRGSVSLLNAIGCSELVTNDLASYEKLAIDLALNQTSLLNFRRRIEEGRRGHAPFDTVGLCKDLEDLYEKMIARSI